MFLISMTSPCVDMLIATCQYHDLVLVTCKYILCYAYFFVRGVFNSYSELINTRYIDNSKRNWPLSLAPISSPLTPSCPSKLARMISSACVFKESLLPLPCPTPSFTCQKRLRNGIFRGGVEDEFYRIPP